MAPMPRAVWTGALSFGLVSIPVALYPATSPKDVRFHLFDREGRRVRYRRVVEDESASEEEPRAASVADGKPSDGSPVEDEDEVASTDRMQTSGGGSLGSSDERELAFDELVRGYEVEPGRFAMLEPAEINERAPSQVERSSWSISSSSPTSIRCSSRSPITWRRDLMLRSHTLCSFESWTGPARSG